jgi:hypothetical protein
MPRLMTSYLYSQPFTLLTALYISVISYISGSTKSAGSQHIKVREFMISSSWFSRLFLICNRLYSKFFYPLVKNK